MRLIAAALIGFGLAAAAQEETGIPWIRSYDEGLVQLREHHKPLFLEFYADWCGPCKQMDAEVYSQPEVIKALEPYACVKINVDEAMNVAAAYQVNSIPRFVVVHENGRIIGDQIGFVKKDYFLNVLAMIAEDAAAGIEGEPIPEVGAGPVPEATPQERVADAEGAEDWLKLLGDADPKVREAAGAELAERGAPGASILVEALANDYLGTRIGAYEALMKNKLSELPFDPWADLAERKAALKAWRVWRDKQPAASNDPDALTRPIATPEVQ